MSLYIKLYAHLNYLHGLFLKYNSGVRFHFKGLWTKLPHSPREKWYLFPHLPGGERVPISLQQTWQMWTPLHPCPRNLKNKKMNTWHGLWVAVFGSEDSEAHLFLLYDATLFLFFVFYLNMMLLLRHTGEQIITHLWILWLLCGIIFSGFCFHGPPWLQAEGTSEPNREWACTVNANPTVTLLHSVTLGTALNRSCVTASLQNSVTVPSRKEA